MAREREKVKLAYGQRFRSRTGIHYLVLAALPERDRYRICGPDGRTVYIQNPKKLENGGIVWEDGNPADWGHS